MEGVKAVLGPCTGAILSTFKGIFSSPTIPIDFEKPTPSEPEKALYDKLENTFVEAEGMLKIITEYKDAQEFCRIAMSKPSPDSEKDAFENLLACVDCVASIFEFSKALSSTVENLLHALANDVEHQDALFYQLARLFDFVLQFDRARMEKPKLSNDFSFYRRLLPKFTKHPLLKIKDDAASGMALFTAEHIPMMNAVNKAGTTAAATNPTVLSVLAKLAMSCEGMLRMKRFTDDKLNILCARALTGAIVMYDNVDTVGAFHRRSPIDVKACVTRLKRDFPEKDYTPLLNGIHYSTKNYSSASAATQSLFE